MVRGSPIVPLLLITILALVVPVLTSRIRRIHFPIVVGEILAGIVIGRTGLDLVPSTPILDFLAQFGFSLLMFLSGLEINPRMLLAAPESKTAHDMARPLPLAAVSFLMTLGLAVLIGYGLTAAGLARDAILMGLILSTTSVGIVVPILKQRNLVPTAYGQTILICAILSDFVTLFVLSVVIALLTRGLDFEVLLVMALLAVFVAAIRASRKVAGIPLVKRLGEELSHATSQIQVRGAFALMIVWVALAESLGTEVILGAFMAGAILSFAGDGENSALREKLDAIGYGFLVPIFFISVGANFDLRALMVSPSDLMLVPVLIISAYGVKLLPAVIFRKYFTWRESVAAGTLLSSRLSMIIAASAIALKLGLISTATNSAIILVAIFTCTLSPLLFSHILPSRASVRKGVVILGTDDLAALLGFRLQDSGEKVTLIGRDQRRLKRLAAGSFGVVPGDPSDPLVVERAGLASARALVAVSQAADTVLAVCRMARERYGIPVVVAQTDDPELVKELRAADIRVVQPAMAVALALEGALRFPAAFSILLDKADNVDIVDAPLVNITLVGSPLRRIHLPGDALVLGIHRKGEVVVPHGDTILEKEDTLVLIGRPGALQQAVSWLGTESPRST